jgi:ribosomal protein L29
MPGKKIAEFVKELRTLDNAALDAKLAIAKEDNYNIRRSRISQPEVNVKATRVNKKAIARILTIKKQREIAAQQGAK